MVLPHRTLRERYELHSEVGRGGMGRVWRAHDTGLNRTVAVKEILLGPGLDEEERARVAARARREAQATAMGQHPNIVTVYDIVEDDGRPWIVMELLDGDSLLRLMRERGPVPPQRAAAWGLGLLDALETAHGQGITHRDVKPENVMVTAAGRVVLTDFGIATIVDTAAVTQTSGVMGSAAYVAPERLNSRPATPASDLWSLGATLYHAVTGVSPFLREGVPATLHAVLSADPPEILPGPLGDAVRGLLVKDPDRRLDARGCRELLSAAARGETGISALTVAHLPPAAPGAGDGSAPLGTTGLPGATGPVGATVAFGPSTPSPPAPAAPGEATATRRPRRLTWPVVVLTLGLAALLIAASLVVVDRWGGTGQDGSPSHEAGVPTDEGDPTAPVAEEDEVPSAEGMTWTEDPEGFALLVPGGWERRTDGASVFYDSPTSNAYLQIDRTPHSVEDEYEHVLEQESNSVAENRLPGYQRIRVEDVTSETSFVSAADWEFSWDRGEGAWRLLARNINATEGEFYTLAWSSGEDLWAEDASLREQAISSFDPF
ncbi:serine/threonine-protein kinase [Nocardiopsis sp. L17-MgMaSL7]|uniref:serine/threonine-protein kinase n=1 Tax=Nocardiopsis sp. L17-MgMaSL7 TaxID=1938893 RepID=UPI000D7093D9|nr:serine/threonine-protein kinase [Nocardiopsis sp. L17-MgMaSL7]PWV55070.1 protein kinase-like protein [Nocardiopsis sp. L17-MgMaSL7]